MPHTLFAINQDKQKTACKVYIAEILFSLKLLMELCQNVISMTNFITEYCMKAHFLNVYVPLLYCKQGL
jgi:hypothetical protein